MTNNTLAPMWTDAERAVFEKWAEPILALARDGERYADGYTRTVWDAWQTRAALAAPAQADHWQDAVVNACMATEACLDCSDPAGTVNNLIDWHIENDRFHAAAPAHAGEYPELDDSELEDLAHAANQEALSYGVSLDVFMRLAKTVRQRAARGAAQAAPVDAAVQRDAAIGMLADWVDAVNTNGTGWDDWDEHFKDAAFRPGPLRELLDEAIAARAAQEGK